jgi:Amt family ammonium transporter
LIGYGFAYGETSDNFIGTTKFASNNFEGTTDYRDWMFQWAFAGTAATIVSGCLAERTQIIAYLCYSLFITGFIYPLIVHWTWGSGWLYDLNYLDFAGSGIVHLVGGVAGLVGCYVVGPRMGRLWCL